MAIPQTSPPQEIPKPRRKFVPQLIETSKRSKKAGDTRPATLPTDKVCGPFYFVNWLAVANACLRQTDLTPGIPNIYTRSKGHFHKQGSPNPPANTPETSSLVIPPLPPRRQQSMRPHLNTRRSTRQDSFQPDLDVIPSSGENSNEEDDGSPGASTPSLSGSIGSSEDCNVRLQMARTRESCDERFSGYLLELAAKAAEKQLREQALAAFPNETFHEIVEHFYDREVEAGSDGGSVEGIGFLVDDSRVSPQVRRQSTEVGWAAKEIQAHQEKLNRLREEETNKKIAAEATLPTFPDPFWTNGMTSKIPQPEQHPHDAQKEAQLERMRSAASPPMLGEDLKFRMCPSPKATKFESDQKHDVHISRCDKGGGLWGGFCVAEEEGEFLKPAKKRPGLIHTPYPEREDPLSSAVTQDVPGGAKSPRSGGDSGVKLLSGLDEKLQAEVARAKAEEALLAEFNDSFITQVYNYISLGYPALARQFDEELARISRIPSEELSADDHKRKAKGYLGISKGGSGSESDPSRCPRWKALKKYIHEWARQHPSMSNGSSNPNSWGVRARRGSWAI